MVRLNNHNGPHADVDAMKTLIRSKERELLATLDRRRVTGGGSCGRW
jgi:hypothetical protein